MRPRFVQVVWFSLFASLLVLAPSAYMLEVYDRVLNSRNLTTLGMLTLLVVGAYGVMEMLEWARANMLHEAGVAFDQHLHPRVFDAVFQAELKRPSGGSIQPLHDLRTVREFFQAPVLTALLDAPIALVFLILVFVISPVLGWSAVVGVLGQTGLAWLAERSTLEPLLAANRSAIALQHYLEGILRNAQVVESMGMLDNLRDRWSRKQQACLALQTQASETAGLLQAWSRLLQQMMGSLLLGLAALLLLRN
ncbi:MAG: hypothetical protein RLZZ401_2465, partial [Pseudomonadota bacterium]